MNKFLSVFLCIIILLCGLVGCGKKADKEQNDTSSDTSSENTSSTDESENPLISDLPILEDGSIGLPFEGNPIELPDDEFE